MKTTNHKLNFVVLTLMSVMLSAFTVVLGAMPLRVLFKNYRRSAVWFICGLILAAVWMAGAKPAAISLATVVILVGVFTELERARLNLFFNGVISVFLAGFAAFELTHIWMKQNGWLLSEKIKNQIDILVQQAQQLHPSKVQFDVDSLYVQIPSAVVGLLIVTLAIAIIFEKRLSGITPRPRERLSKQALSRFKLPDFMIWVAMFSFLLSFVDLQNQVLANWSVNIFNVSVVLYFLQGLAVLETLFRVFEVGPFMKWIVYTILVTQLFFAVSALGFIDFWMDFRNRFSKTKTGAMTK